VNLSLGEVFAVVAELAGRPRPRIRIPYSALAVLARARLVNSDEALLARLPMTFSWEKAARELGYAPGPVWPALGRAVDEALSGCDARAT
jgi:dihydroflavonol-4-reductase